MSAQRQASSASQTPHLSPAELSYLYTSLSLPNAPIRPDGRSATQFRPLAAETDVLPGANGSARVGFADGTQAVVGVKAEVEKTVLGSDTTAAAAAGDNDGAGVAGGDGQAPGQGHGSWVQMSIEIPGFRDDDALPVFLAEMMREPLVESVSEGGSGGMTGGLKARLVINRRWHWRLYIDVLLLSQPLSYPLPLLSLTTHLALLSTKLPKLKSQGEEDPFFDDDWNAAEYLYPRSATPSLKQQQVRPPVTLLVIAVGENVIFDPNREEIAVADTVLAVSVTRNDGSDGLKLLSIRTVDPPSRLTQPGVPNTENAATGGAATGGGATESGEVPGVWRPRRGGVKRSTIARMAKLVLQRGGVGEEVLEGLEGVQVG
ncbi:exosome non-catalytic core subunit RRP42 [Aspergillus candidus]|uniref:Ribosomal RNA-processing protein 42 n=1 Tax=Aspergillus candidus TaxID=41067 RepID=A0A2I2FHS9_ASPCN|nr:ribosomal protein S5 domain 2-type protein [Aspergillus candidus]PLB40186.1 ribosomal protein S5 domain 2-type protein [Aspergillus candidus]